MPNVTYNLDIPATANSPAEDQPDMLTNTNAVNTLLVVDHYSFNDNNGGYHQKATFVEQGLDPSAVANTAIVYSKDDGSGNTKLMVKRNAPALNFDITFVKAWGVFNGSTGTLISGYNCSTARSGTGSYTVTFTVPLANTSYGVVTGLQMTSAFTTGGIGGVNNLTTNSFNLYVRSLTSAAGSDLNPVSFVVIG